KGARPSASSGYRFLRWLVVRRDIDRRVLVPKSKSKDLAQALREQRRRVYVRPLFSHLADQLPFDQFQLLLLQQTRRFESRAFRSGPTLSWRIQGNRTGGRLG